MDLTRQSFKHHIISCKLHAPKFVMHKHNSARPSYNSRKRMEGLVQCSANYVPLSPISFLERAAFVYGNKVSILYGDHCFSWKETYERCLRLASALSQMGVVRGEVVAALAPNIPALYELYFGVPMAGAVLSALNTRLDPSTLALTLEQLQAKIIFVDYLFVEVVLDALDLLSLAKANAKPQFIIVILDNNDQEITSPATKELPPGSLLDYDELLATGQVDFEIIRPIDECHPISVNYTSGSTGKPKGAVYSHRAAYLNSLAEIFRTDMRPMPVFLWTVDMFRCSGWCFPWAVAALGGTNICLRNVTAKVIFDSIRLHHVTHLCGAPTILNVIAESPSSTHQQPLPCKVVVTVAGALPPPEIVQKVFGMGFCISHAYGMTEALGPVTLVKLSKTGDMSNNNDHENVRCRQGMHNIMMDGVDVKDPTTMTSVALDGKTIGEVMFKGNTMMMGYLNNLQQTRQAFEGGWYRTGDIGVKHPNGYIEMKDRAVDAILTARGETVSTIEVEYVLSSHPMVVKAAVVGRPDHDRLGERVGAFVRLKEGCYASAQEIIKFCGDRLPPYMVPQSIVFGDLPVNSTGKVQKFVLRETAKAMGTDSISPSNGH